MSFTMLQRVVTSAPDRATLEAWERFLRKSEFASCYVAPYFLSVPFFRDQGAFAILVLLGNDVVAVATGVRNPKFVECGNAGSPQVLIDGDCDVEEASSCLAAALSGLRPSQTVTAFCWGSSPGFMRAGFKERTCVSPLAPRLINLRAGADDIFKAFSATARNEVRKAVKMGVTVSELQIDAEFDDYYQMYEAWSRAKKLATVPIETLRASLSQTSNRLVLAARCGGRIVAVSSFRHYSPGLVEYAANVSRLEDRKLRPNGLLVWKAIEWAVQHGFCWFSMGGDHFFLSQFGGDVHPVCRYRKDLTLLKRYDAREWTHSMLLRAYHRIPKPLRIRLTGAIRGRGSERS